MMNEYAFEVGSTDTSVAFDCEADRAQREGFKGVEKRQRDNALHVRNAVDHMQKLCPEGYRVVTKIVVSLEPSVNAFLRDDVREGRA